MNSKSISLWVVRVSAVLLLIMGVVIWPGNSDWLISPHIALGVILTIALLVLAYQLGRSGVSRGLVALMILWALALPILGLTQGIFPDSLALAGQVFHLLVGVGAWVLAEVLVRRAPR